MYWTSARVLSTVTLPVRLPHLRCAFNLKFALLSDEEADARVLVLFGRLRVIVTTRPELELEQQGLRRALLALTYRRDYMKNMPHLALVSQWALT
jgi:hypothetical protein